VTTRTLPPSRMCSVTEGAAILGVSRRHLANLIANGDLPVTIRHAGNRVLINRQQLEAWCDGDTDTEAAP
jgi:excisionase family DNA binding protein